MRRILSAILLSAVALFITSGNFAIATGVPAPAHYLTLPATAPAQTPPAHFLTLPATSTVQTAPTAQPATQIPQPAPQLTQPSTATPATASNEYTLAAGDHIHLTVYGEDDLSGDYVVGDTGFVALPLIGSIMASGLNKHQVEDAIRVKLANGYLHDPKVSIQLLNYRPFFILGEVAKPGSYPYVDGMNVLNAVALAGGYTYRASTSRIKIIHAKDPNKTESDAQETDAVAPGDIIKVPERYF